MRASPIARSPLTVSTNHYDTSPSYSSKVKAENYKVSDYSYKQTSTATATSDYRANADFKSSLLNHPSVSPISRLTSSALNNTEHSDYSTTVEPLKTSAYRRDSWDVLNRVENELNSSVSYERSRVEDQTKTNTTFNKFSLSDSTYLNDDYGSSKFQPIDSEVGGARAIKVSNKPDGYLGQPFEFDSESCKFVAKKLFLREFNHCS